MIKKRDFKNAKVKPYYYPDTSNVSNNIIIKDDIITLLLNKSIPNKKAKEKMKDEDFIVPDYNEYIQIININYNLTQLKLITKHYKIKNSGNKEELKKRVYNFLLLTFNILKIQKNYRRFLVKKYIYYHGPGFKDKSLCTNDTDFCSLDNIIEIPYNQFFSFQDEDNFIYAFDINSIYNLYLKNKTQVENPFNKKILSKKVYTNLSKFINYSKLLNIEINIDFEKLNLVNEHQKLEMKILNLFQTMDSLGNYTNMTWFNSLNKHDLIKFLRELIEIWNYRANLTQESKREICPPFGNPFRNMNIHINYIHSYNINIIKKNAVNIIDDLINKGINNDARSLGCYYVLSALTLVNQDAADALPWLYESVMYD